jgi:hypothetical protein
MTEKTARITSFATASLATILLFCGTAAAQSTEVKGVIDGRSGATMTVKSQDSGSDVVVLLTDSTQVEEIEGGLHMRKKQMGTSRQVAPDTTSEGQAENRRVVVRILQNKGIAGT